MALEEGQFSIRGLVMGAGTPFRLMDETNPFVLNVRAEQGDARAWGHGAWSGAEWADQKTVPLRLLIEGGDTAGVLAAQQQLLAAFAPVEDAPGDVELRFRLGGAEYVLFGRPRMVEPEMELLGTGRLATRAAFVALDPLIYSADVHEQRLGLPSIVGGVTLPLTVPITIGATVTAGRATVTNAGTTTVGLRLRIDGPVDQPRVSLLTGEAVATLRLNLTLDVGQWLDIDTGARTVYLNGSASRRGNASGGWPVLAPGTSELAFGAAVFDPNALLTASWRDAWT